MEFRKDIAKIKKNPYIRWKKIEVSHLKHNFGTLNTHTYIVCYLILDLFNFVLQCPRQPLGSKDCGYYVGRYIIEIIESRQLFIPEKVIKNLNSFTFFSTCQI